MRLTDLPITTKAILWDMDGVLIDSLGLDVKVCNDLVKKSFGSEVKLTRDYIQSIFAYDIPLFWEMILQKVNEEYGYANAKNSKAEILTAYNKVRQNYKFELNPGIEVLLKEFQTQGFKQIVVSNNPKQDIEEILENVGIKKYFDFVVGNDVNIDGKKLNKKPAPDTYLYAMKKLQLDSNECVVIEDSVIGVEAGKAAKCFTITAATGGALISELKNSSANTVYKDLTLEV